MSLPQTEDKNTGSAFGAFFYSAWNSAFYEYGDELYCNLLAADSSSCKARQKKCQIQHIAENSTAVFIGTMFGYLLTPFAALIFVMMGKAKSTGDIFRIHLFSEVFEGFVSASGEYMTLGDPGAAFWTVVFASLAGLMRGTILAMIHEYKKGILRKLVVLTLASVIIVTLFGVFDAANAGVGAIIKGGSPPPPLRQKFEAQSQGRSYQPSKVFSPAKAATPTKTPSAKSSIAPAFGNNAGRGLNAASSLSPPVKRIKPTKPDLSASWSKAQASGASSSPTKQAAPKANVKKIQPEKTRPLTASPAPKSLDRTQRPAKTALSKKQPQKLRPTAKRHSNPRPKIDNVKSDIMKSRLPDFNRKSAKPQQHGSVIQKLRKLQPTTPSKARSQAGAAIQKVEKAEATTTTAIKKSNANKQLAKTKKQTKEKVEAEKVSTAKTLRTNRQAAKKVTAQTSANNRALGQRRLLTNKKLEGQREATKRATTQTTANNRALGQRRQLTNKKLEGQREATTRATAQTTANNRVLGQRRQQTNKRLEGQREAATRATAQTTANNRALRLRRQQTNKRLQPQRQNKKGAPLRKPKIYKAQNTKSEHVTKGKNGTNKTVSVKQISRLNGVGRRYYQSLRSQGVPAIDAFSAAKGNMMNVPYASRIRNRILEQPVGHNFPRSIDKRLFEQPPVVVRGGGLGYAVQGTRSGSPVIFNAIIKNGKIIHRDVIPTTQWEQRTRSFGWPGNLNDVPSGTTNWSGR